MKNKGITLIALVITIIVLLILAGVTISLVVGDNGVISKAKEAGSKTKEEAGREKIVLALSDMQIEELGDLTLEKVGDHIHEKLKIDKEDVTKNGTPVKSVTVIYEEYEYEIDDKFNVKIVGPAKGAKPEVSHMVDTEEEGVEQVTITVTATIAEGNTIVSITKPDGESVTGTNTTTYTVTENGSYEFVVEGSSGRRARYTVEIRNIGEKFSEIKTAPETITQGNKTAVVPKGFAVGISDTINKIENGLVITDKVNEFGSSIGNEFVWVPVEVAGSDTETNIASFKRTTTYDETITVPSSDYTEPYSQSSLSITNDVTGEYAEYAEMVKSVYQNKGFYVARYEAGCEKERTLANKAQEAYQGTANPVLSQKNKFVYNYVPWGASMESTAEASGVKGAVELARGMYPASNTSYGAVSHLMYGVQWDTVMHFVQDSTHSVTNSRSWGNYNNSIGEAEEGKGQLRKTGYNKVWKAKNMYDLAGNAAEWTMEASYTNYRVVRGGRYNYDGTVYPTSYRSNVYTDGVGDGSVTFRTVLYVKSN